MVRVLSQSDEKLYQCGGATLVSDPVNMLNRGTLFLGTAFIWGRLRKQAEVLFDLSRWGECFCRSSLTKNNFEYFHHFGTRDVLARLLARMQLIDVHPSAKCVQQVYAVPYVRECQRSADRHHAIDGACRQYSCELGQVVAVETKIA